MKYILSLQSWIIPVLLLLVCLFGLILTLHPTYFLHLGINTCHHCPGRRTMIKIKINSWSCRLSSLVLINILSLLQLISSLHNNYYLVLLSLLHLASSFVFFFRQLCCLDFLRQLHCCSERALLQAFSLLWHSKTCIQLWLLSSGGGLDIKNLKMLPAFISLTRALTRPGLNILSYQNVASHFEKWVKVTVTLLFVTLLEDPTLHSGSGLARN